MRQEVIDQLQQKIHGSPEQRLGHKMHAVLFREKGMEYPELTKWFGESQRTLARWVRAYKLSGFEGLLEKQEGRPKRLSADQRAEVIAAIARGPRSVGLAINEWTAQAAGWSVRVGGSGRGSHFGSASFVECSPSLSLWVYVPRTVLAVKGSLRRAQQRRALDSSGPFCKTFPTREKGSLENGL
jgi:hypothetical protein